MKISAFVALVGIATLASAETTDFYAHIDGVQSGTGSPALGELNGTYDSVANSFSFTWNISDDLIGNPASPGSHIHRAPLGSNGPIVFGFNNPDGTWPLNGSATWTGLSDTNVADLFAGNFYVNFHTSQFPSGEVRGQIFVVPAPGSAALLLIGAAARRRRR